MKLPILVLCSAVGAATAMHGASTQERIATATAQVYDLSSLHRIEITVAAGDVARIRQRTNERVRCTFSFDGTVLKDVGIRQAGGTFNPFVALTEKPTLSVKFDDFVEGQELHGLEKMILKDGRQDLSLVNEHLTYEVFRRAGIAAPMTAHAQVTINGVDCGIYVMREPVNRDFLTRNFGRPNANGNVYELSYTPDPMVEPTRIPLRDEASQNRNRAELLGAAAAVRNATDDDFAAAISRHLDLDRYITFYAVEAATSNFDDFSFNLNNAYLYTHPRDGRLIFIPYGADSSFWATVPITRLRSPFQPPRAMLARRIQAIPALASRFAAELQRVGSEAVWDKRALLDRVAQVDRILTTARPAPRTNADLQKFKTQRPTIEAFIASSGTIRTTAR